MPASPPRERFRCPACGRPLHNSADGDLPVICPQCGSRTDRPLDHDSIADADRHLIVSGTTEDDGQSYGVFGQKPLPPCPGCGKPLPDDANVCEKCNWHRDAGKVLPRSYAPVNQSWEAGWTFSQRIIALGVFQILNLLSGVTLYLTTGGLPTTLSGWVVFSVMQAFVLGTYDRLTLRLMTKGKVTLTKSWRVCFWPLTPRPIRWRI